MKRVAIVAALLLATLLTSAAWADEAHGPELQATLVRGADFRIALKVFNPAPQAIVLISPGHPAFVSDAETCLVTVTSVVTGDGPDFDFTPTQVRVEAGGTWGTVVTVRSFKAVAKKCTRVTYQVKLAYLVAEDAVAPKLTRDSALRLQRVLTSEKLAL